MKKKKKNKKKEMSRDDSWINSPKEDWTFGYPSPVCNYDADFDLSPNFNFSDMQIPNSPQLELSEAPQPSFVPPLQAEKPVFSAPQVPLHARHRRTPSMPVSAVAVLDFPTFQVSPLENKAPAPSHVRSGSMPDQVLAVDDAFAAMCADQNVKFNPSKLGFIPSKIWADEDLTFGDIVTQFFQKKNNANSRFSHKLFNALKITDYDHFYFLFLGVEWVNEKVLKVDKKVFARLLGIRTIDGSFFHQQGNFPSHSFIELDPNTAAHCLEQKDLEGVDYDNVRLLVHQDGIFIRGCTESVLESCKWVSTKKRVP